MNQNKVKMLEELEAYLTSRLRHLVPNDAESEACAELLAKVQQMKRIEVGG